MCVRGRERVSMHVCQGEGEGEEEYAYVTCVLDTVEDYMYV